MNEWINTKDYQGAKDRNTENILKEVKSGSERGSWGGSKSFVNAHPHEMLKEPSTPYERVQSMDGSQANYLCNF